MNTRSSPQARLGHPSFLPQVLALLGIFVAGASLAVLAIGAGWFCDRAVKDRDSASSNRPRVQPSTRPSGPVASGPVVSGPVASPEAVPVSPMFAAPERPAADSAETREAGDSGASRLLLSGDGAQWRQASTGERREACRLAAQWLSPEATQEWQADRAAFYFQELETLYGDPRWETVPLLDLVPLLQADAERDRE